MARRPNDPQRRERILQATLDTIAAHGIHAVTHRKIATCANVPLGSLTYYFKPLKARSVESRQREPMRLGNRGGIDHAHHKRQRIAHQHADQDRDNRQEAAEQHGSEHRHRQGHHRDNNGFTVR